VWGLVPVRGVFRQVTGNGTVSAAGDVTGTITVAARSVHTKNNEYGDYECPYSRQAFHAIEQAGRRLGGNVRFAFWHPDAVHSAGWCTAAATTRPACWRHWPLQSDQKPRRSLTMIAVIRPAVITLLMMRMLFTRLGTP
jgi:hypothetical protein